RRNVVSGGVRSTCQVQTAGDGSTWLPASYARTRNVCAPAASGPGIVRGDVQSDQTIGVSSEHSKVAPAWLAANVNDASVAVVARGGPLVIIVSMTAGSPLSRRTTKPRAGPPPELNPSTAIENVVPPSAEILTLLKLPAPVSSSFER